MNEREVFADEQAYITHRRHEASMARAERLRQAAARLANTPKAIAERKRHNAIYRRIRRNMRQRNYQRLRRSNPDFRRASAEYNKRWRQNNPDRWRAYDRAYRRNRYWTDENYREYMRALGRQSAHERWYRDVDASRARANAYYAANREAIRVYIKTWRDSRPEVIARRQRAAVRQAEREARKSEQQNRRDQRAEQRAMRDHRVMTMRAEGATWGAIAQAVGLGTDSSALRAWQRAMRRKKPTAAA